MILILNSEYNVYDRFVYHSISNRDRPDCGFDIDLEARYLVSENLV